MSETSDTKSISLLAKLQEKQSLFVAPNEETLEVTISDIKPTSDERRVMLVTNKGNIFAWRNVFDGGVPVASKEFRATVTLRENKEFVNVSRVKYNLEETGKYSFVATNKLSVVL